MMQLDWKPHLPTASLYAGHAVACDLPLVDSRLAEEFGASSAALQAFLEDLGQPPNNTWRQLTGFAFDFEPGRELAQRLLRRLGLYNSSETEPLASLLSDVAAAGRRAFPDFQAEAKLRTGPLQQQWEARGPGLLQAMARLTDEDLFVERAVVVLTPPVLGGGGWPYLEGNRVLLEAVLVNPLPHLPEVLRLAWMLAQLQLDLPRFSEQIPGDRLEAVTELAMLPAVLAAGEQVELTHFDEAMLHQALQGWRPPHLESQDLEDILFSWWETYQETRMSFVTALPALDRLLH